MTKTLYVYKAVVKEVVDGDTMLMNIDLGFDIWTIHKLRVAKFDAPEIFHPSCDAELRHGVKAREFAIKLLIDRPLILNTTRTTASDKYGRYLTSIETPDGDFATIMTENGFRKLKIYE